MVFIKSKSKNIPRPDFSAINTWRILALLLFPAMLTGCGDGSNSIAGNTSIGSSSEYQAPLAASAVVPAAPSGLAITSGSGEVALSWNDVPGASYYNVYYLTYPGVTTSNARQLVAAISGDPITGLKDTVPYYFRVTAINSLGESVASAEVSATPMPALPGIPGNVRLTGGVGEATLSWQAVPYATSYNVYYGTAPGLTATSPKNYKGVTLTSQKITGLTEAPGHYYFIVTAVDASGEGQPSIELPAIAKSAYKSLAAGYGFSAALRIIEPVLKVNEGTVWEWGDNSSGQLGTGTNYPLERLTADMVPTFTAGTKISAGYHHMISLKTDLSVMDWGLNNKGQIGDNHTTTNTTTPTHSYSPYAMTAVAGGYQHTVALKSDGTVWSWGNNLMGALGYKSINCENPGDFTQPLAWTCSYTPTQVTGITGSGAAIAAGFNHTLAVTSDGQVWAWGRNDTGQLGSINPTCPGTIMAAVPEDVGFTAGWVTPSTAYSCSTDAVQVSAIPGTVIAVAAGTRHSVALMSDGTVWTWGGNHWGQLGYTPTIPNCTITSAFKMACSTTPTKVLGLDHIIAISAGSDHTLALKGDGTVWQWGMRVTGPTNIPYSSNTALPVLTGVTFDQMPTQVAGLTGITAIAAGTYHSLALKNDGTVWGWGYNGHGQLGDNTKIDKATPVQVQGLLGPVAIIPGI